MILLKMIYDIECSTFRKKNFCDETFPLSIVNNSLLIVQNMFLNRSSFVIFLFQSFNRILILKN